MGHRLQPVPTADLNKRTTTLEAETDQGRCLHTGQVIRVPESWPMGVVV